MRGLLMMLISFAISGPAIAYDWIRKDAGSDWTWFETYVFSYASYRVACEPARECQVGMGVFLLGQPRGEKIKFSGEQDILVVGAGAIYIRAYDNKGIVKAAVLFTDAKLIETPPIRW